ncbi:hypothetical protein DYB26_012982 [Aphanomyces astaci]|uniref:Uncharacterized protein n=1 Tax=Aphanomyces astaci TaxID=112090 RepID=A0A418FB72_APHAT|nr:hypothetical protein DYB26_012982 [Aphanomyces astaci]
MASAATSTALNYPYRPIHKQQHLSPPTASPPPLTREEMGWQTLKDPRTLRPTALKSKAPKPRFKLNKTQKREFGWNTSFPAEYGLVSNLHDFYAVVEVYMAYCPLATVTNLVTFRAEACHPASDSNWLANLHDLVAMFFASTGVHVIIRLQALCVVHEIVTLCRHICEDRVLDDLFVPCLQLVHDDDDPQACVACGRLHFEY